MIIFDEPFGLVLLCFLISKPILTLKTKKKNTKGNPLPFEMNEDASYELIDQELLQRDFQAIETIAVSKYYFRRLYINKKTEFALKIIPKRHIFGSIELKNSILREFEVAQRVGTFWAHLLGFNDFFYTKNHAVFV